MESGLILVFESEAVTAIPFDVNIILVLVE
jgi:hypothetical protein